MNEPAKVVYKRSLPEVPGATLTGDKMGYWFQVVAANGEPLCTSEPYVTEANVVQGFRDLYMAIVGMFQECEFEQVKEWEEDDGRGS